MNGTNGNEPGYPERALVSYPVISAATKNSPDTMKIALQHLSGYIIRPSIRKLYDERGNIYFGVDHDIRERLQVKLTMAVLTFKVEEQTIAARCLLSPPFPFRHWRGSKVILSLDKESGTR